MQELEITWDRALRVWWCFWWRALTGTLVLAFGIGFVIGVVQALIGIHTNVLSGVAGAVVGIAFSVIAMKMALMKKYRDFRIALLANVNPRQI